jgi:hypothetical protein
MENYFSYLEAVAAAEEEAADAMAAEFIAAEVPVGEEGGEVEDSV